MFNLFKRKVRTADLRLIELCADGYCAVVGESYYQDALLATRGICTTCPEDRPMFTAALVPEPENPYDSDAIAVYSSAGKVGHLSRDHAQGYQPVLKEVTRRGSQGGACDAYLTGGEPGKPSFGVVLRLADPVTCLADLRGENIDDAVDTEDRSGPGFVGGRHYTEYVEAVKALRRSGQEIDAEKLLLELIDATEAEARANNWGVAPWYYEQLAISCRKRQDPQGEVDILERYARHTHAPGVRPPELLMRLEKAKTRLGALNAKRADG